MTMLIAMMGNTYQTIAMISNEWQRQWARIVLVVERGVHPKERLQKQELYVKNMADGRKALMVRSKFNEEEQKDIKSIEKIKMAHKKYAKRKGRKSQILVTPSSSSPVSDDPEFSISA